MTSLPIQSRTRALRPSRRSFKVVDIFIYILLIIVVAITLYPVLWMMISSFRGSEEIAAAPLGLHLHTLTLNNYSVLLSSVPMGLGFQNTLIVLIFKGGLTLFFCPLAGFAFAKFRFRGRNVLFALVLATLTVPLVVTLIPLLLEMGTLNWVDTYQGLIFPGAISAFYIFWMRQQIAEVPDELLDAAKIDGCSAFGMFWRIVVPIIRPAMAALAILTFLDIYNDYVWPLIVTSSTQMQTLQVMLSTLEAAINNAQPGMSGHSVWGEILAGTTLATIPVLILFLVMQRQFIRGILSGGLKG